MASHQEAILDAFALQQTLRRSSIWRRCPASAVAMEELDEVSVDG